MFSGLSAFPLTPTDIDGVVLQADFEALLARIMDASVHSIGVLGSTGGYAYVAIEMRKQVAEIALRFNNQAIPIIIGVGAMRTDDAVHLAQHGEQHGADGLLLAPISYTPLTENEVYSHFLTVAQATALPLCIYNNPSTTGFKFSVELIQKLAQIENIKSIKMPLPADSDFVREMALIKSHTPVDFTVGYSGDWHCTAAMKAGSDAWYSAIGGLFPNETLALLNAVQSGDIKRITQHEGKFLPFFDLMKQYGSYRVLYAAANHLGLTKAQPHLPILPLHDVAEKKRVTEAINALQS